MTSPALRVFAAGMFVFGPPIAAVPRTADAAECGTDAPITVAQMTWPSAEVLAHVTKIVLTEGYGCAVELRLGNTEPTARTILSHGKPQVVPEFWISLVEELWTSIEKKGLALRGADVYRDGAEQGFWVPDYVYNAHPDVRSITDLKQNWKYFTTPASPDRGRIYSCPPGWGCAVFNGNLFRALGLGETFEMVLQGSVSNLSGVLARKVARREPFVVYQWAPTVEVEAFKLVKLKTPAYDPAKYACLTDLYCADPKVSGWKPSKVVTAVTTDLHDKAPQPAEAILKMSFPNDAILQVLKWGYDNRMEPQDKAGYFFTNFEDVWTDWVPADVAADIKAGLK